MTQEASQALVVGGGIWTVLLSYLGHQLLGFLRQKMVQSFNEDVTIEVVNIAKNVCIMTYQQYVKGIKDAREDGKLTSEEKEAAFLMARETFFQSIKGESLEFLKNHIDDIEKYVAGMIERSLCDVKKESR